MVDSICGFLIKQMRSQMPEIDDERAEVIKYGLENLIRRIAESFYYVYFGSNAWCTRLNSYFIFFYRNL